jgi:CP family cyanate transporter-like MFS transporter
VSDPRPGEPEYARSAGAGDIAATDIARDAGTADGDQDAPASEISAPVTEIGTPAASAGEPDIPIAVPGSSTPSDAPRTHPSTPAAAGAAPLGPPGGRVLALVGILLVAVNLRPLVNALGAVIPELQVATGLSGTASGVLLALPTLCFALVGFVAPTLAGRLGTHRTVLLALVVLTGGQLLRAVVPGLPALFLGSILGLAGAAVGNVLLPGLVRLHFPQSIPAVTAGYTTLLMLGGTTGAGLTLPIEHALGGDWRTGIGMWAATAVIAIVPWVAMAIPRPPTAVHARNRRLPLRMLASAPLAWAMAGFFGSQSLQAYVQFGWLPSIFTTAGLSDTAAAAQVAIIAGVGIPIAAIVPWLLGRLRRPDGLVVGFGICYTAGYVGLIVAPASVPWLFSLLLGVGGGAFPMALTLIALRTRSPQGTMALSGFTQSAGYLIASIGPVGFGFLHDVTGSWTAPLVVLIGVVVVMVACGLRVARPRTLEDEIAGHRVTTQHLPPA